MGGSSSMKSVYGNIHQHGTNGNRKKYLLTMVILLVFGGSVLGLMRTQRLRDKRIFDILIKEKESQILSLQMHLQNEREHVQNGKMRADELKLKVYNLRAQKKELQGKIHEMQSAMMSLKEEQKAIESAYEEQHNETKLLREKCSQNPKLESLTELLRKKEAEIDELHRQIQLPRKGSSVSKDDQSNSLAKINLSGRIVDGSGEHPVDIERSTKNGTSTTEEKARSTEIGDRSEDRNFSKKTKTAFSRRNGQVYALQSGIESKRNVSETAKTKDNEEQKPKEEVGDGKEIKTVHRGGVRLEMRNNGRNRSRGNYGTLKKLKGKGLRALQKQTQEILGSDEAKITMRDQHYEKHDEQTNSKAYAKEITREYDEDSHPGNQNNANQTKTDYRSQNEAAEVNEENRQQGILEHSSADTSSVRLSEVHHYTTEGTNSGSSYEQEDSVIRHHTGMENGNGNYESPGIKSEVNKNQDENSGSSYEQEDSMIRHHTGMENGNGNYESPGVNSEVSKNQDEAGMDFEESEIVTSDSRELEYDMQKNSGGEEANTDEPEF